MRNILTKDVVAENAKAKVVLTYFGWGYDGEFDATNLADEPLLYADLYTRIDDNPAEDFCDEPEEMVCTYISARITEDEAQRMVDKILQNLDTAHFGEVNYEFLLDRAIMLARDERE